MIATMVTIEWVIPAIAVALAVVSGIALGRQILRLRRSEADLQRVTMERDFLQRQLTQLEQQKLDSLQLLKAGFDEAKQAMAERLREQENRWREQQKTTLDQFRSLSSQILSDNTHQLKVSNMEQMTAVLNPLKEQIAGLGKAVQQTNTTNASNTASLGEMIKQMMERADRIGNDAVNLTRALKGDTKKQGDWGELVLERMLEESGLKKGEEYYIQPDFTTDEGRHVRPDVVVRFPEDRSVIIDSKVSLTAYAAYTAAESDEERSSALAAHVESVRKHMNELAQKDYTATVSESVGYVLMFIPNEASYIAAVQARPELPLEGYRMRVLIISPTNLLMALQLAFNLWQKERQTRNVEAIFKKAAAIYDKCVGLTASFEEVGKSLHKALDAHDEAMRRFTSGRGNLTRQVEDLRSMGVSPAKRLNLTDDSDAAASEA